MAEVSDQELLDALGVEVRREKKSTHTPREERVIAGFEEIQRFVEEQGHLPEHGENKDIFERMYAARLEKIQESEECRKVLIDFDDNGLLDLSIVESPISTDEIDDEALLSELGVSVSAESDVTNLKHVKKRVEVRAAEEIARRIPCADFKDFESIFLKVQEELNNKERKTRRFQRDAEVGQGDWFILSGQKVYIAEVGEEFINDYDRPDRRLRVIYDNGTESNILLRSLQRALYKDEGGRRITDATAGPLFSGEVDDGDIESGTIYVLRSKSDEPIIKKNREVVHKIGVTGGSVDKRIANAKIDPTFLMADVEVVATYELSNINRSKLENLIHKFFEPAKLDIEIKDRFGKPVVPKEWFLVPIFVIDDVIEKIKDGTIVDYSYDSKTGKIVR